MAFEKKIYLALAIVLTAITSLACHALIVQNFTAPHLVIPKNINIITSLIIEIAFISTSTLIFHLSNTFWKSLSLFRQVLFFSILILALTQHFRNILMNIVVGVPWQRQLLLALPSFLSFGVMSFIICYFYPKISKQKAYNWLIYTLFIIITTLLVFLTKKLCATLIHPLMAYTPEIINIRPPPYKMNVLIPAYLSAIEPTIASFIVFYLIQDCLSKYNTFIKGLIMGSIIILLYAGIYSFIQIAYSQGNFLYRLFYYGQFLWEYIALGLLTAYFVTRLTANHGSCFHKQQG